MHGVLSGYTVYFAVHSISDFCRPTQAIWATWLMKLLRLGTRLYV